METAESLQKQTVKQTFQLMNNFKELFQQQNIKFQEILPKKKEKKLQLLSMAKQQYKHLWSVNPYTPNFYEAISSGEETPDPGEDSFEIAKKERIKQQELESQAQFSPSGQQPIAMHDKDSQQTSIPSIQDVLQYYNDEYTTYEKTDIDFKQDSHPALYISEIPKTTEPDQILEFLNRIPKIKEISNFKAIYKDSYINCVVKPSDLSNVMTIKNKLKGNTNREIKALFGEKYKVTFQFDKLNKPEFVKDYYAIILRNIPNMSSKQIEKLFNQKLTSEIDVINVGEPQLIKQSYCSIVVVKNLDQAEFLCKKLNKTKFDDQTIKCNIHPSCSRIRQDYGQNGLFKKYLKNTKSVTRIKEKDWQYEFEEFQKEYKDLIGKQKEYRQRVEQEERLKRQKQILLEKTEKEKQEREKLMQLKQQWDRQQKNQMQQQGFDPMNQQAQFKNNQKGMRQNQYPIQMPPQQICQELILNL